MLVAAVPRSPRAAAAVATAAAQRPTVEPKGPSTETIAIEAGNFYFKPDTITATPGIATITLTAANGIHDLVFDGAYPGFLLEADGGGGAQSKKIDLKPGKYTFYCNIPGHRAAGMQGTLTVK